MDYGVGVKNKFDLFDQDITDPDFIHIGAKKQGHQKNTTDKKPLQKSTVTAEKNKQVTVKSAPVKTTVQKTTVNDVKSRSNDTRDSNRRNDKGNRNDKRTGGSGKERSGKREFDRKSGSDKSGVKPVEKREGFGKSNWGNFTEDAETTQEQPTELNNDEELNNNNEEIENVEPAGPEVEEPKVLTLEEYRKQEQEKRLVPKFNIRKPGEGDTQQWKKGYVLKKDEEEEEQVVVYEEIEVEEKQQGRHKKILDIDITFRDGHRNGYGGFRGDRRRDGRGPRDRKDFGDKRGDRSFRDGGDKEHREERPRRDGDRPPREEHKRRNNENSEEKDGGSKPFKGGFRRRDGEEGGFRRRDGEEGGFRRRDGEEGGFRRRDGEEGEEKSDRPRRDFNRKREDRPPREDGDKEHRDERPPRRDGDRPPRERGDRPPRRDGDRPPRDGDNNRGPRRPQGYFRKGGKASAPKFDDLNDLNQFPSLGLNGTKVEK